MFHRRRSRTRKARCSGLQVSDRSIHAASSQVIDLGVNHPPRAATNRRARGGAFRKGWSQPLVDGCDQHGRFVADGELVVSRGDCTVALEAIDSALHRVALLVVVLVELRRPAAVGTALLAVGDLVALLRDRAADTRLRR